MNWEKSGFSGPVYCTGGTSDLCGILLPDSGNLQEEDTNASIVGAIGG